MNTLNALENEKVNCNIFFGWVSVFKHWQNWPLNHQQEASIGAMKNMVDSSAEANLTLYLTRIEVWLRVLKSSIFRVWPRAKSHFLPKRNFLFFPRGGYCAPFLLNIRFQQGK